MCNFFLMQKLLTISRPTANQQESRTSQPWTHLHRNRRGNTWENKSKKKHRSEKKWEKKKQDKKWGKKIGQNKVILFSCEFCVEDMHSCNGWTKIWQPISDVHENRFTNMFTRNRISTVFQCSLTCSLTCSLRLGSLRESCWFPRFTSRFTRNRI